jgi:hypothetical protein
MGDAWGLLQRLHTGVAGGVGRGRRRRGVLGRAQFVGDMVGRAGPLPHRDAPPQPRHRAPVLVGNPLRRLLCLRTRAVRVARAR